MAEPTLEKVLEKMRELEQEAEEAALERRQLENELERLTSRTRTSLENRLEQAASLSMSRIGGITSYSLKCHQNWFEFQVFGAKKDTVMTAHLERSEDGGEPHFAAVIKGSKSAQELRMDCCSSKTSICLGRRELSFADLEQVELEGLVRQYNLYFEDFLIGVVKDMQRQNMERTLDDTAKTVLSTIKDISCLAAGYGWIAAAIFGPTCLGTIIAEAADP